MMLVRCGADRRTHLLVVEVYCRLASPDLAFQDEQFHHFL